MVSIALLSVTTVIFGIAALILASKARNKLSQGSLRKYIDNYSVCLAFIVIFSVWLTVRSMTNIDVSLAGFSGYPEFIFIVFAYIGFVIASYRVSKISEEFGFKEDGKEIVKLVKHRKKS
jgi:cytochrome bd-type quinol oxidase subunit 2